MINRSDRKTILIIEDDKKTTEVLALYLEKEGYQPIAAANGQTAIDLFKHHHPILILLDLMIPKRDGLEVCKQVRLLSDVPIIMITARVEEADKLVGLALGADDYVVKPFSPREVMARIKAILRRVRSAPAAPPRQYQFDGLEIDANKFKATLYGKPIPLTALEVRLLLTLMESPGHVFSREVLLNAIYPMGDINVLDRTVDVHIRNLREKIEKNPGKPHYIKTVRGAGYQFAEE